MASPMPSSCTPSCSAPPATTADEPPRSAEALDDHGHALAATDAHRFESERPVGGLQAVDESGHDAGARHAERVAKGDAAAVHVELVPIDAEVLGGRNDLGGERLVDLDEVDVVDSLDGAV